MPYVENDKTELKQTVTDELKKEIVAFANTDGGQIYIGIKDDGTVCGVENADAVMQQAANMIRDSIQPDVTLFIKYIAEVIEGKNVVRIDVQRGTNRPYYIIGKGIRPEGVFVRQGTEKAPASMAAIRQMIKETDGDSFESMRSTEQELTFSAATEEFKQRGVDFGRMQQQTLGLINRDGVYTNLALLLSDQCSHTIKAACFEGSDKAVFQDRREFSGSLLKQLNDVYEYIDIHNQTRSTFDKLRRIDSRDYPEQALREALLNSLVHRDYSYSASTLISIYSNKLEIVSIGGLPSGTTLNDIMLGLSVCRNAKLANVFYRLELIEAYGTGIRKIMDAYAQSSEKPSIQVSDNAFKITLPNINSGINDISLSDNEKAAIAYINATGAATRKQIEALLNISQSSATRLLNSIEGTHITRIGSGKGTKYIPAK